ncbi:MAG TPA: hypothetical protein VNH18_11070 [Bryobacteraceae bacterium]|nr:hypothetical protein [Bryobacteraceae bacterium]
MQEVEFTNELGVPDMRVVRSKHFSFDVTFTVQRTATMETTIEDADGVRTTYQAGEVYSEAHTYTFDAKVWQNSRIYLTRKGDKGTIQYGWYEIKTGQFYATDKRNLLVEWPAMVRAFRAALGYTK